MGKKRREKKGGLHSWSTWLTNQSYNVSTWLNKNSSVPSCKLWHLSHLWWPTPLTDKDFGKVDGQFMHARWWLLSPILDVHTLLHCGQVKVSAEDDWDAARSFWSLHLSFAASNLFALNLQLSFLTDKQQLSWSEASCCHDWWLIPACASCLFSWSL